MGHSKGHSGKTALGQNVHLLPRKSALGWSRRRCEMQVMVDWGEHGQNRIGSGRGAGSPELWL